MDQYKTLSQHSLSREDRSWPRRSCSYITTCRDIYGNVRTVRVINISGSGLGIILNFSLRIGEIVHIVDPYVTAKVIWSSDGKVGLQVCH